MSEFLLDIEITDEKLCRDCKSLRREYMKYVIINEHEKSLGSWVNTICPNCKTKVMYWDGKKRDEHYCTACEAVVTV